MASIGPVVSEEMFENVDIHTHTRMREAYLYYKLTNDPKDSGELNELKILAYLRKIRFTDINGCTYCNSYLIRKVNSLYT